MPEAADWGVEWHRAGIEVQLIHLANANCCLADPFTRVGRCRAMRNSMLPFAPFSSEVPE